MSETFPLQKKFRGRIVPALLGFLGITLLIVGLTAKNAVETIYLELAQKRAQTIERAVAGSSTDAWSALMAGRTLTDLQEMGSAAELAAAFAVEVDQQNLPELKVYDLNRQVLYATNNDEIGLREDGAALRQVIQESEPSIATKVFPDGSEQYELYVPVFGREGELRAVFELYEPVGYLNGILIRSAVPIVAISGALLLILGLALDRLVNAAQSDINRRTNTINELRARLESFVSASAVLAAKSADGVGVIPSERINTTLLFSDIRDFTGFSEQNPPETVVAFLNDLMGLQIDIIEAHGGDVDKLIGDAVLARFDGTDGASRAIAAAREIQSAANSQNFPRDLGIGIFQGSVIAGTIGRKNRRDFTVIGDAVNVTARLCSEAKGGEIVVETSLADEGFLPEESLYVKGKTQSLQVRRQKPDTRVA